LLNKNHNTGPESVAVSTRTGLRGANRRQSEKEKGAFARSRRKNKNKMAALMSANCLEIRPASVTTRAFTYCAL
jgi:hypothetical protein